MELKNKIMRRHIKKITQIGESSFDLYKYEERGWKYEKTYIHELHIVVDLKTGIVINYGGIADIVVNTENYLAKYKENYVYFDEKTIKVIDLTNKDEIIINSIMFDNINLGSEEYYDRLELINSMKYKDYFTFIENNNMVEYN